MTYHHVDPADVDPTPDHPCDRRPVADAAELATLFLAVYDLDPGEDLARVYHYHERREEAFLVLEGRLHVETPERTYVVDAGEVFVAEPGSPHRAHNPADASGTVRVFGTGTPRSDPALAYEPGR